MDEGYGDLLTGHCTEKWGLLGPYWASARFAGLVADTLRAWATQ
jgi:hypothetical protein